MQAWGLRARREGRRVGLVPTMGDLHAGHESLIARARAESDRCVVSLFVNPTQFGPGEDLAAYPRRPLEDAGRCRALGVDVLFMPPPEEVYAPDHTVVVDESRLSARLCGAHRPGHFRGVLTVVAKLFNLVQPAVAYFGQKDAQQCVLIRRMVRDLNIPVEIRVLPTVREPDGVAMSSRNRYLSEAERRRARCLSEALALAQRLAAGGERSSRVLLERMRAHCLEGEPAVDIDYVEAVDPDTLAPVDEVRAGTLIALAVRIGRARLIDNAIIESG